MKLSIIFAIVLFSLHGCASVGNKIPVGAVPLTTDEITTTFSGTKESYVGKDNPSVTANATFGVGGEYEASWAAGNQKGTAKGEWYAEDGKRCLKENKSGEEVSLECHIFYKTGSVYTSVNEDGSIHGIHTLTPLN